MRTPRDDDPCHMPTIVIALRLLPRRSYRHGPPWSGHGRDTTVVGQAWAGTVRGAFRGRTVRPASPPVTGGNRTGTVRAQAGTGGHSAGTGRVQGGHRAGTGRARGEHGRGAVQCKTSSGRHR